MAEPTGNEGALAVAKDSYSLQELADLVNGDVDGKLGTPITGVRGLAEALPGDIAFLANSKYFNQLQSTKASAVVLSKEEQEAPIPMIRVRDPNYAFAQIAQLIMNKPIRKHSGIHPSAIIGQDVTIGRNVTIHANSILCDHVVIGDNTEIYPFCYVGHYATLGADCLIYPHVTIRERCSLGDRVIVHSGAVIGCDGFGYATLKGVHQKIPQIGTVKIGNDVEIGANVTVDRARFESTIIQEGTKIDNLVQIAHNVQVGKHCMIISQTGIAGSSKIGNYVTIAGQVGICGHIEIGDGVQIGGQSGVVRSIPKDSRYVGVPAMPVNKFMRLQGQFRQLGDLFQTVKELTERIEELEQNTENNSKGI